MMDGHWTDEELLNYLYGLKDVDGHLSVCAECSRRARELEGIRAAATHPPEVPEELLAAQRRSIYQRLGSPVHHWHPMRWAVSVIAMLAVIIGLTISHGVKPNRSKDDQFYAEISTLDQNPAPRAVRPIEAMVQDDIEE